MDISENYLNMCNKFFEKHPEYLKIYNYKNNAYIIPKNEKYSTKVGNFMITTTEVANINKIFNDKNKIPLLTIDDCISFISDVNSITLMKLFNNFMNCEKNPAIYEKSQFTSYELEKLYNQRKKYKTIEQMMLGFICHFKYREIWNCENWIHENMFVEKI